MNTKKLFRICIFPLLLICFLSVISSASASFSISGFPYGGTDSVHTTTALPSLPHPSATTSISAVYQLFKVNFDHVYLDSISVNMKKIGAPSAIFKCTLANVTGVWGLNAVPNADLETSSTSYQISGLQTGATTVVTFTFAGTYDLRAGVEYAFYIWEYSEVTCDSLNYANIAYKASSFTAQNLIGVYKSSGWTVTASDQIFGYDIQGTSSTADINPVTYLGGDTIIENNTNTYDVQAGDVQAGDVIVDQVTANFNNTQVSASSEVGTTSTPLPINYLNSAALILLAIVCIFLTIKPSVPILNFVFGLITFGIVAATAGQTDMLLYGFLPILNVIMALICMISGFVSWKR